jgi:ribosomal protein S18 acetylase RimI-like enzyme
VRHFGVANPAMSLEIRFGVMQKQRVKVARMYYETFEDKFSKIFGDKNKFLAFASNCLRDDRTLVAFKNGVAVGFAGLECDGKNFLDADLHHIVKFYGLGAIRLVLFGAIFFFNKAAQNEVILDSIAVSADECGKGIGTKLLHSVIDYAKSNGFSQIKLEVTEKNQKAKKLYERVGFEVRAVKDIPYPFNKLLGFGTVTEMTCKL